MPYSRRPNNSFYDDPPFKTNTFKTNTSTWVSNFTVTQDRVLDHLRVRQPNTFKLPPATKNLIDPNVVNDDDKLVGDNNPVTNSSLRSGVAQAGALVYCTTPIINPPPGSCDACSSSSTIRASDAQNNNRFGDSVAISGDYAIVGAGLGDGVVAGTGAAYIFKSAGAGKWPQTETQKLFASDGQADRFGDSVAISGDYAIVGAALGDGVVAGTGAAYIFKKDPVTGWPQTETQKLFASDGATSDRFGDSVAISGDYAIVGAYRDDNSGGNGAGAAYIFFKDGSGNWSQTQKLLASDGQADDFFGYSVAISGDYAIVGAFGVDGGNYTGAAYIFFNDGSGNWTQTQKLTASGGQVDDRFGRSVAISGYYAIVGAYGVSGGVNTGEAYIFEKDPVTGWPENETQKLTASDGQPDDRFGYSVGISGDYAIVGANWDDNSGGSQAGAAYIFNRNCVNNLGDPWGQVQKINGSDAGDRFGISVAFDGLNGIVGANLVDYEGMNNAGAAYIYQWGSVDRCFDNRNHLYFSDGDQWIPLANCIPTSEPTSGEVDDCCGESFTIDQPESKLSKADSGKTAFFEGPNPSAILPEISETDPDSDGLCYKFVTGTTFTGTWEIYSEFPPVAPSDKFAGQINWISGGGSVAVIVLPVIRNPGISSTPGDWVEVYSFKGKWYVTGESWQDNGIRFNTI